MSGSRPRSAAPGVYADPLSAMSDYVMSNSQPTPTQEEMNKVTQGIPVEIAPDNSPQMPPLHEQYAMLENPPGTPAPSAAAAPAPAPPPQRPAARPS